MLYNSSNVLRSTTVHDLDRRELVRRVMSIDTDRAEVVVCSEPLRAAADGRTILTETVRFASIWPILDDGFPCAFHCHGRLN